MITIRFACGHSMTADDAPVTPICACGERRVTSLASTRPPKFRGSCRGPYAEMDSLPAVPLNVAPGGSLRLKDTNG